MTNLHSGKASNPQSDANETSCMIELGAEVRELPWAIAKRPISDVVNSLGIAPAPRVTRH